MKHYNILTIYVVIVLEFTTSVVVGSPVGTYDWPTATADETSVRRRRPRVPPSTKTVVSSHGSCRPRTAAASDAERPWHAASTARPRLRAAFYALLTSRPDVPRSVIRTVARTFRVSERSLYAILPLPVRHVLLGHTTGDSNAVVATENVLHPLKTTASVSTSTGSPQQAAEPFSSVSSAADDRTPVDDRTETDEDTTGSVRSPSANDDPKSEPADIRRVAPPSSVSSEKLMSLFVPWWAAPPTALVTPPPWGFPKLFRVAGIP